MLEKIKAKRDGALNNINRDIDIIEECVGALRASLDEYHRASEVLRMYYAEEEVKKNKTMMQKLKDKINNFIKIT